MRLVSFNILHGRAFDGGPAPLERLVEGCQSLQADVLCLQEVDRGQARSGDVDQTAAIAEATGAVAWRFQPAVVGEPGVHWRAAVEADEDGPTNDGFRGGYGVALVSRWPVAAWHVLRLVAAPFRSLVFVPGRRAVMLLSDEPRVVLAAELESAAGPLVVASTHLSFVPGWNVVQLRRATRFLAARTTPCVLLGDLNLPGALPRLASGWRPLGRIPTFPADRPSVQIDHALGHGPLPAVVAVAAPRLGLSDHRPLVVDLEDGRRGVAAEQPSALH